MTDDSEILHTEIHQGINVRTPVPVLIFRVSNSRWFTVSALDEFKIHLFTQIGLIFRQAGTIIQLDISI